MLLVIVLGFGVSQALPSQAVTATVYDVASSAGVSRASKTWSANIGDLNGDGWDDMVIVRHGYRGSVYLNDKDGTFTEIQELPGRPETPNNDRHDCDIADINGDGDNDFYCSTGADYGTGVKKNEVWIQGPNGLFTDEVDTYGAADPYGRGRWMTFIDANNDPYPDLFVGNITGRKDGIPSPNRFFLNDGGTRFVEAPEWGVTLEERSYCAVAVDIDNDGWEDLVNCATKNLRVYRNVNGTNFQNIATSLGLGASGRVGAISFADFDDDGDLDLVMTKQGVLSVRLRSGTSYGAAVFSRSITAPRDTPVGDFDGDGDVDILSVDADVFTKGDTLLLNGGTGGAPGNGTSWTAVETPAPGKGVGDTGSTLDYNHDGKDDFIVLNGNVGPPEDAGPAQLFSSVPWTLIGPDEDPPTITLTTPANLATYAQNATINASYSCSDNGGSGIATCAGPVPSGSPIDTSTLGPHTFTVNAEDNQGNTDSVTHTYTVVEAPPASITATGLTSSYDSVDRTAYTTGSVAPGPDKLVLLTLWVRGPVGEPTSVSGNGLTWELEEKLGFDGAQGVNVAVYRAMGSSPTAGTITISLPATASGAAWSVVEVGGVNTTGSNGAQAIAQSVAASGTGTTGTITLASFESASNATFGAFGHNANEATTPEVGYTELHDVAGGSPLVALQTEWRPDNDTSVSASWATSSSWRGIALELRAA